MEVKSLRSQGFDLLQKMGKAIMFPISILPVAGLLLGIGGAMLSAIDRGAVEISNPALIGLFQIMKMAGEPIFANLPIIFAIGIAIGLTNYDGVASIAAVIGYVVLLGTMGVLAPMFGMSTKAVMGITSIDTGIFGGILVGLMSAGFFNRFYRIQLPQYIGFFAGKRSVPIITAFGAMGLGLALCFIWPPIQNAIDTFSHFASKENPGLAVFIYGVVERSLIPFGLHHIWNVPFFFQIGEYVTPSGEVVRGELSRFFAGDPTAGILGGGYLFKMWGLPAAAIAIWHTAKPERKSLVSGIMISAALTSFLTGITEPIEFSFLFVAPALYAIHAFLSGLSFLVSYLLGAKLGYTFSHGFIDYVIFFVMGTKPWLVMVIGPLWGLLYYGTFRWVIQRFQLRTPGRESETSGAGELNVASDSQSIAPQLIAAFGGAKNIRSLDACITRLRVAVVDPQIVHPAQLKDLGATGVMNIGNSFQAVFGPKSEILKIEMDGLLQNRATPIADENRLAAKSPHTVTSEQIEKLISALGGKSNIEDIRAVAGTRVRAVLKDAGQVNLPALKSQGVQDLMRVNDFTIHLLMGLPRTL